MLPADAIGMLNVTYEFDTGGEHGPARDIEVFDPEPDHRARGEEGMKFVGRTIELQNSTVGEPEPYEVIGLPGDRHTNDIPEQGNSFVQPITSDSHEADLQHRHCLLRVTPARSDHDAGRGWFRVGISTTITIAFS
jgi:hypothetical protein